MPMIPDRDIDHVGQGLGLLLNQFKNKPRLAAWATAYLRQCQLLEDAIYDVMIKRLIDNATGIRLDVIGKIVGEPRSDRDDPTYKIFIFARIRVNRSRGALIDVLEVIAMITATPLLLREYQPACIAIEMLAIPDRDPVLIYIILRDTKAGGVKLSMISPTSTTKMFLPMSAGVHLTGADGTIYAASPARLGSGLVTFVPGVAGGTVTISGAANPDNNGTFPITAYINTALFNYNNPLRDPADANNGSISFVIDHGPVGTSDPLHAAGDARATPATLLSATFAPFVLSDGLVLDMLVDGVADSVTFFATDFVNIALATAEEVVLVLNRKRRRRYFATVEIIGIDHYIRITTYRTGVTATFLVVHGGAYFPGLLLSTEEAFGTYDTTYGLLSDVISVRDPNAEPIVAPPAPPVVLFLGP